MKEENKKSKKKILLYYLILAACLLVIAAVTVTVIFTVDRNNGTNISIDNNVEDDGEKQPGVDEGDNNPGNNEGEGEGEGDKDPDNTPSGSTTEFFLPVSSVNVTNGYELAYDVTLRLFQVHQGMDFDGEAGDKVFAVLDGTVSAVVRDNFIGENYVTITHADGMTTTYKYIDASESLKVGDSVKRGDQIGTIAQAAGMEMKQGEHLHFEVKVNGRTADPDVYLNILQK